MGFMSCALRFQRLTGRTNGLGTIALIALVPPNGHIVETPDFARSSPQNAGAAGRWA
jgi:hypothetical protein